jgi:fructose-bisphosphate aldolase class 1
MNTHELLDTARALVADDKGLLAIDESNPTCNTRFAKLGILQTVEARRASAELSRQIQPGATPRRIQCRDGKRDGHDDVLFPTRKSGGIAHPEGY